MPDATFNGDYVFGTCEMNHEDPPNAVQMNHYPGTLGVERLDLGEAESYTIVHGELYGDTPEDLGSACQTIRNLKKNATLGTLIDTDGAEWNDSVIESFRTIGRSVYSPQAGWCRKYEAKIIHIGIESDGDGEPTDPNAPTDGE